MVSSGIPGAHTRGKYNCPEKAFLQGLECILGGSDPVTPTTPHGIHFVYEKRVLVCLLTEYLRECLSIHDDGRWRLAHGIVVTKWTKHFPNAPRRNDAQTTGLARI